MKFTFSQAFIVIFCICFAGFIVTGCKNNKKKIAADAKPVAPPPPKVDGYIIKTTTLSQDIELPGTIIANEATEIHPEMSGRLTYLNATEGRNVSQGTLIAKIYDGDLRAQLQKLNIQLQVQEQTAKRYEELLR